LKGKKKLPEKVTYIPLAPSHSIIHSKSFSSDVLLIDKGKVKIAGYWPSSVFVCLWTEKGKHAKKKNEANIKPS